MEDWATNTWWLPDEDPLAQILTKAAAEYRALLVRGQAHPNGPPRRTISFALVNYLLDTMPKTEQTADWVRYHLTLKSPE
eukprot:7141070-Heterocapsa_arctica.AAC.1